ncbi:MAG: hypothetical protein AB7G09_10945 [Pseudonocardia sp.]|jgi:hypothetical protein
MNPTITAEVIAGRLAEVAALVESGALREARRRTGRLLSDADEDTQQLLTQCLRALERHPQVRTARLRHLWKTSGDDGRALVEACLPRSDRQDQPRAGLPRPQAPAGDGGAARRAPRDLPRRWIAPQPRPSQRSMDAGTAAGRYFEDRVEPETDRDDRRDDARPLDYDLAAVPPLRGLPCVVCRTERCARDQQRHHDDGLCEHCRDRGREGISAPSAPATREAWVIARCRHIAATSATTAERVARLRADWRHLDHTDRATVARWVSTQAG